MGSCPPGLRAALLVGGVAAALQLAAFHSLRHDDAYITFRYGANLATGQGLVFNPGERIMGSTSPGQAFVAAGVHLVVGHDRVPAVMSILGCLAWSAEALLLFLLLYRRLGGLGAGLVAGLVMAGAGGGAQWVALETHLAVALALLALVLGAAGRWPGAAVAVAAAALFRADALILGLPLGVLAVRDRGWRALGPLALGGLLTLPWPLVAWWYYGSPMPQSLIAKVHATPPLAYAAHVLRRLPVETCGAATHPLLAAALWALAGYGAVVLARRDRRLLVLPAYGLLHAVAYVALGPLPAFTWHLYPAALVFAVLVATALSRGVALVPRARWALAGLVLLLPLVGTARFGLTHRTAYWNGARDTVYHRIAVYLRERATAGDVVHLGEIGTIAYVSGLRVNDAAGLVTRNPEALLDDRRAGRPSRLRWLVLTEGAADQARALGGVQPPVPFAYGEWRLLVADLAASPDPR